MPAAATVRAAAPASALPPPLTPCAALCAAINITSDGSGWAEDGDTAEDFTENELAAKAAGQPCLCQHVPGSGIALLVLGVLLLCLSRIPPILNKEHHTMQFVRARPRLHAAAAEARSDAAAGDVSAQGGEGRKWPCWCITCRWMKRCAPLPAPRVLVSP